MVNVLRPLSELGSYEITVTVECDGRYSSTQLSSAPVGAPFNVFVSANSSHRIDGFQTDPDAVDPRFNATKLAFKNLTPVLAREPENKQGSEEKEENSKGEEEEDDDDEAESEEEEKQLKQTANVPAGEKRAKLNIVNDAEEESSEGGEEDNEELKHNVGVAHSSGDEGQAKRARTEGRSQAPAHEESRENPGGLGKHGINEREGRLMGVPISTHPPPQPSAFAVPSKVADVSALERFARLHASTPPPSSSRAGRKTKTPPSKPAGGKITTPNRHVREVPRAPKVHRAIYYAHLEEGKDVEVVFSEGTKFTYFTGTVLNVRLDLKKVDLQMKQGNEVMNNVDIHTTRPLYQDERRIARAELGVDAYLKDEHVDVQTEDGVWVSGRVFEALGMTGKPGKAPRPYFTGIIDGEFDGNAYPRSFMRPAASYKLAAKKWVP